MVSARVIFVIGSLLVAVKAQSCVDPWFPEGYECPQDCARDQENGCIRCSCGGQVVPAEPPSCFSKDKYICPPFCGTKPEIIDQFGCVSCTCGATPILKCPSLTDAECPAHCSRTRDSENCEVCDCNDCAQERFWYPKEYECPQDCGRQQKNNCIQCSCGGEVVEAAKPSCYPSSRYHCAPEPFCGMNVDRFGCVTCRCGDEPSLN